MKRSLESFGAVADAYSAKPTDNAPFFHDAVAWATQEGGDLYSAAPAGQSGYGIFSNGFATKKGIRLLMNGAAIVPLGTESITCASFIGSKGAARQIASDVLEGSKKVELVDAAGIGKGAWLSLQSKPDTLPYRFTMMAQVVQVEGNWIELSLPLTFPMSLADQEAIVVPADLLDGGGVEDCLIDLSLYRGLQVRGIRALWTSNQTYDLRIVRDDAGRERDSSYSEAGATLLSGFGNRVAIECQGIGTSGLFDFSFQQQTMGDAVAISHNCGASPDLVSQGSYNRARLESYGAFGRGIRVYSERHSNFPAPVCEDAGMTGLSLAYGTAHCGFNGFRLRRNGGPQEAGLWLNGQGGINYNQFTDGSSLESGGPNDIAILGRGNLVLRCEGRINDLGEGTVIV